MIRLPKNIGGDEGETTVSMRPGDWSEIPVQTVTVAPVACPKGTRAMRLRDALGPLFDGEQFADCFAAEDRSGNAARDAGVGAASDGEHHRPGRRRSRPYPAGLELDDPGFDFLVLSGDRAGRLLELTLQRAG